VVLTIDNFLKECLVMRNFMVQRLLKYVGCFFCTVVCLANGEQVSFAGREDEEAVSHNAGKDCLTSGCHASGGWKRFSLGGTIYTDAEGTAAMADAQIEAVDANGITVNLTSDQIGNIYSAQSMTAPFTISVSYRGRMVKMPGAASGGGCNADNCHVVGSAGRVYISTADLDLTGMVTGINMESSSEIRYNSNSGSEMNKDWMVKYHGRESLSGLETDGAVVANAKASLSRNSRIKYRATTDSTGAFTFKKVKANEYTLKVTRKGYKVYRQPYEMKQKDVTPLEITLSKK
jgi:hypothetical protein